MANWLKSVFVILYMMAALAVAGHAVWALAQGGHGLAWTGVLLTVLPFLGLLAWLMTKGQARTSDNLPWISLAGVAGVAAAGWAVVVDGAAPLALWLAAAGMAGLFLYIHWYSRLPRQRGIIVPGARLPDFKLKTMDGGVIASAQLCGRPTILIFYRGNWCPLCMAQVKELAAHYRDIAALGARVALISPQPHANTVALARQFDVSFDFFIDEGNAAARALGIAAPHGVPMGMQMMGYDSETVMPTVIITNREGAIIWADETDNYRVRPEPGLFLDVLRRNGITGAA